MSQADREKWDVRYRTQGPESTAPSSFLTSIELPGRGRALDVAGGAGRNALWLARHGLDVTLVDISAEGLVLASAAAAKAGVSLSLVAADLESDALPPGPFDVIISFNFLRRGLFAAFAPALAPGGLLIYLQPTRSNLERHPRPPADFLLEDGELPKLVQGLEILRYEEDWSTDDSPRHEARLVARKPA
jgi:tellurite methyltransferase